MVAENTVRVVHGVEISPMLVAGEGKTDALLLRHLGSDRKFQAHITRRDLDAAGAVRYMLAEIIDGAAGPGIRTESIERCIEMVVSMTATKKIA